MLIRTLTLPGIKDVNFDFRQLSVKPLRIMICWSSYFLFPTKIAMTVSFSWGSKNVALNKLIYSLYFIVTQPFHPWAQNSLAPMGWWIPPPPPMETLYGCFCQYFEIPAKLIIVGLMQKETVRSSKLMKLRSCNTNYLIYLIRKVNLKKKSQHFRIGLRVRPKNFSNFVVSNWSQYIASKSQPLSGYIY